MIKKMDGEEYELPDTMFVRDIDNRVFQEIVLQCLSNIPGIGLVEGSFFDSLLGRSGTERIKGVVVTQESKNHSVSVKVEVNVAYGISIPEKSEEIQKKVAADITNLTGLHVSCVHVIFKGVASPEPVPAKEVDPEEELEKTDAS